ncbi:MAG: tetratricopeptide repeat protein [Planctomycetes bacterium]|nr:tetratricopeptide repeat protein [Planctomycetota bacterium]
MSGTAFQTAAEARPPALHVDPAPREPFVLKDVWSRSGSKYRIRSIVLLSVNVLLFAGVGTFAFWLRSGVVFAPSLEGYWEQIARTFQFGRRTSVTLGSLLLEPINVQQVEMQIWVAGLLMAALISIPILVSILYRFWSSLPFIAIVGLLAVMPWLAITLLGSCVIASVRPFRSRVRFMSALFGLVPAVVYLILAWRGTADLVAGDIDPVDRIKFVAPWVLAIVASTAVFAIVLLIAKVVDYRPGATTPLLALMFGLPVGLFEFHVGRDELYYRLLESMSRAYFLDVDTSLDIEKAMEEMWERRPLRSRDPRSIEATAGRQWLFGLSADVGSFRSLLTRNQAELAYRCDWFRKYFPDSRYALHVLYLKARALDLRIDPGEFRRTKWIRFYDDFPGPASRESWRMLAEHGGETPLAALAELRLAQLDARAGEVDRALERLSRAATRLQPAQPGPESAPEEARSTLELPVERLRMEVEWLRRLLTDNDDPLYGFAPLTGPRKPAADPWFGLLDLDPRDERLGENLQRLRDAYPNGKLDDNLRLEEAKGTYLLPSRIERLEACLRDAPEGDAAPEALFRLAVACRDLGQRDRSAAAFAELMARFPDTFWAARAAESRRLDPRNSAAERQRSTGW